MNVAVRVVFSAAAGALIALLGASVALARSPAESHAAALERWRAAAPPSYRYAYRKRCECYVDQPPETVVSVDAGRIVDVRYRRDDYLADIPVDAHRQQWYWTIDDLFTMISTAIERPADVLRVSYDEQLGYPVSIYIDYDRASVGEEVDVGLTEFLPRDGGF